MVTLPPPSPQKQIVCCGGRRLSGVAADEVLFLRTLCVVMQRDPRLADFFLQVCEGEDVGE